MSHMSGTTALLDESLIQDVDSTRSRLKVLLCDATWAKQEWFKVLCNTESWATAGK